MTRLLLISEPKLPSEHRDWIEAVRAQNDPQYDLVPAHFTLVFPVTSIDETSFVKHCTKVAEASRPIAFSLRCARAVKDPLSETTHVYLIPEDGYAAIVELHHRLYDGRLSSARSDIPFIPHVTVAAFADRGRARELAERLNAHPLPIEGMVETLLAIRYDGRAVQRLEQIRLGFHR